MLIAGRMNNGQLNEEQLTIIKLRDLGYSRVKVLKLLRMGRKRLDTVSTNYGLKNKHERFFKDEDTLKLRISRALIDLGLYHDLTLKDIEEFLKEPVEIIKYGKDRRSGKFNKRSKV